jgi:hypothetical protein
VSNQPDYSKAIVKEYIPPPTLLKFHRSFAPVRGVCGGTGSGKSTGMIAEIMNRARKQEPDAAGFRPTSWLVARSCFDDRTEILTEKRGWVLFKDLDASDRVASLVGATTLAWEKPTEYITSPWDGEMIGFQNQGIDFLVTPTHKLYLSKVETRKRTWGKYQFVTAEQAIKLRSGYRVKRDVLPQSGSAGFSRKFFEWAGFWFAEGSLKTARNRSPSLQVTQVNKSGISYFRKLTTDASIPMYENPRGHGSGINFRLPISDGFQYLTQLLSSCGNALTKRVPQWIKDAPAEHIESFLNGFLEGDGCLSNGVLTAYTSSKGLASDIQELAFRCGMVANISSRDRTGPNSSNGFSPNAPEYTITFLKKGKYHTMLQALSPAKKCVGWYRTHYTGTVYCVEVSEHVVYVRRGGVAHWSSQTYPELYSTTIDLWNKWVPYGKINMSPPIHWKYRQANCLPDGTGIDMEVWFISAKDADDIDKLRSFNVTGVWLNEAQQIEDPQVIYWLNNRAGRFPDPQRAPLTWSGMIMDANAMDTDHWWYDWAEVSKPAGYQFFKQPPCVIKQDGVWVINPECENLSGQGKGANYWLDQVPGKQDSWIKLNFCAEYGQTASGRLVYTEFEETRHVAKEDLKPIPGIPLMVAFDYGLTPTAVIAQITPQGQLRIIDEVCSVSMGMRQFMRDALKPLLANQYPGFAVRGYGEPSGNTRAQSDESTANDEIRSHGIEVTTAPTNLFKPRRDAVAAFMLKHVQSWITGKPMEEGFLVSPRCKTILKGFREKYVLKKVKVEGKDLWRDEAVGNGYDHAMDCIQVLALCYDRPRQDKTMMDRLMGGDSKDFEVTFANDYPVI